MPTPPWKPSRPVSSLDDGMILAVGRQQQQNQRRWRTVAACSGIEIADVVSKATPEGKVNAVRRLRNEEGKVDVVDGDGVNNAVLFGKRDGDQRWCSAGGAKRKVEGGMEGVVVGSMEGRADSTSDSPTKQD